jgi:hypothetical protein
VPQPALVSNHVRASVTRRTMASMPFTVMRSRKPANHGAEGNVSIACGTSTSLSSAG